jgi:pSer/pThr/pTyr-binding forkhead associated (FHA) protein
VTPFVLSVLKYSLLVLLYFFVFRAVRSVALDVAGRRRDRRTTEMRSPTAPFAAARSSKGGKPPSHVIVHEPDGSKARNVKLSGSTQIGRGAGCAIRLSDTYVSQVHARLYGENGSWFVEDLGSTNGTYLNDRKVSSPVEVHAGDVVKVGKTVLELRR